MGKRYTVVLPDEWSGEFEKLAKEERRTFSSMAAILIEDALKARGLKPKKIPSPESNKGEAGGKK